ncbi:MAG: HEAT repeat domain-containing protein [Dehalococcoidales bacterium]|nr:HEAT repeat domain-containing protein [Dehalococcoidales bacterium]
MAVHIPVSRLIDDLKSNDSLTRVNARMALLSRGNEALLPLILLLHSGKYWERWEAAKTLEQMGNPLATKALVKALRDEKFEIRWLAAEGLINIGKSVLKPLAEALMDDPDSVLLQQGAHHVLKGISESGNTGYITELLEALECRVPSVEVPFAASSMVQALQGQC